VRAGPEAPLLFRATKNAIGQWQCFGKIINVPGQLLLFCLSAGNILSGCNGGKLAMKSIFDEPEVYAQAVRASAESFISRFGKLADVQAWAAARMPTLTHSERAYCEAVAALVSRRIGALARPAA
jgi:hypothetical protein